MFSKFPSSLWRTLLVMVFCAANACPVLARSEVPVGRTILVYFGTFSKGDKGGVFSSQLDLATGSLTPARRVAGVDNPGFLAISTDQQRLYAIVDAREQDRSLGAVAAFRISANGDLVPINTMKTDGGTFCHVSLDRTGRFLFAARYGDGNAVVMPLDESGAVQPVSSTVQHSGSGPNKNRQERAHAHAINIAPDNRFAFVADLGTDEIRSYRFDASRGALQPNDPPGAKLAPGSGPRHFAFHPMRPLAYAVCELDQTVVTLQYDSEKGTMTPVHTAAIIPDDVTGEQKAAEVVVHPSGKYVYASNRGHDALVVYRVDEESGHLTFVERHEKDIDYPRNFAIDPTGRWLLCANRATDNVRVYRIDPVSGGLTDTQTSTSVPQPVCVRFAMRK
jgi:6-phosphogluconolactonase